MYYSLISSMKKQNIVTNGLNLYIDAAQSISYPGTGTIWTDLSVNAKNGTLVNGPTYSSDNGGCIVFDGVNDFVSWGSSSFLTGLINITASIWVKPLTLPGATYGFYSPFSRYSASNGWEIIYFNNNTFHFGGREQSGAGNYIGTTTTNTYPLNSWYNVVGTKSNNNWSVYVNGVLQTSRNQGNGTTPFITNNLFIGNEFNAIFANIRVSNALIYNRALSASEITQNYNALKSRYGL